jgi:hypothetical protein
MLLWPKVASCLEYMLFLSDLLAWKWHADKTDASNADFHGFIKKYLNYLCLDKILNRSFTKIHHNNTPI